MSVKKILVENLIFHLKKSGFIKYMVNYIDKEIPFTIFPVAKREGLTINQWVRDVEDDKKQHTVLTTTRLSYDGVKSFLVYGLNQFLKKYQDANIKILKLDDVVDKKEIKNKSFDAIFEFNGEIIIVEIKVTQNDGGFTGATHTTSKADTYLLIAISIDRDKKVVENSNFVNGVFAIMLNLDKDSWKGEAKKTSSYTQLKLLSSENYDNNIICGKLKKNKKYQKMIFEKI